MGFGVILPTSPDRLWHEFCRWRSLTPRPVVLRPRRRAPPADPTTPDRDCEVLVLCFGGGLTGPAIAALLEVTLAKFCRSCHGRCASSGPSSTRRVYLSPARDRARSR